MPKKKDALTDEEMKNKIFSEKELFSSTIFVLRRIATLKYVTSPTSKKKAELIEAILDKQKQQIDVGIGGKLFAPEAPDGDNSRQGGRFGRVYGLRRQSVQIAQNIVERVGIGVHRFQSVREIQPLGERLKQAGAPFFQSGDNGGASLGFPSVGQSHGIICFNA